MRTDDLFDLLGDIEDRFYLEAMCEEPLEAIPVIVKKRRHGFGKVAAVFALIIGITAAAALLYNKGTLTLDGGIGTGSEKTSELSSETTASITYFEESLAVITDLNRTVSPDVQVTTPTLEQIREAAGCVLTDQHYRETMENGIYSNTDGTVLTAKDLYCYTIDLNFDNIEEIVLVSWEHSGIYIFEIKDGKAVLNCVINKKNSEFTVDEESFCRLSPYYGDDNTNIDYPDGECYYYFYDSDEGGEESEISASAAAIKYDKETNTYRCEFMMFYAAQKIGEEWENYFSAASAPGMISEGDFEKLWYKHEELPAIVLGQNIEYCKKYMADNYDEIFPPDKRGYFSGITEEELSFYVKDLNLDGNPEIAVVSWEHSPIFVFGHTKEGYVFDSIIGRDKVRSYLNQENFSAISAYEGEEEKYCYYYFTLDNVFEEKSRNMAALKYNTEKGGYYVDHYLIYGIESKDGGVNWEPFFRKIVMGEEGKEMTYEEFSEIWNRHGELEPVSLVDIRKSLSLY